MIGHSSLRPPNFFGQRTGTFRLGKDALLSNDKGSSISFEDYAVALVDEIENPHILVSALPWVINP